MRDIGSAPILKEIQADQAWKKWLTDVGDGVNGRWGLEKRDLSLTNLATPDIEYLSYMGRELSFLLVWENGVTFNSSSIALNRSDLTMLPGMLQIWDNLDIVGGAYCAEREVNFKDIVVSGRCIVQGKVFTKVSDPRTTGGI